MTIQAVEKYLAGNCFQDSLFHRDGRLQPCPQSSQAQLTEYVTGGMDCQQTLLPFRRKHQEFDLPGLYEVDHVSRIPTYIDRLVTGDSNRAEIHLPLQRLAK